MAREALMTSQFSISHTIMSPEISISSPGDYISDENDFESSLESGCNDHQSCPDCRMGTPLFFKAQQMSNSNGTFNSISQDNDDSRGIHNDSHCSHQIVPCKDFGSKMSLSDSAISSNGTLDFKI